MKKRLIGMLLVFCMALGMLPATALAAATLKDVELLTEPQTLTYQVGGAFQAKEISFLATYSDGTTKTITHESLKITANGTSVKQGYKFKEAGTKKVIVTYKDYEHKYTINVTAKGVSTSKKQLSSIALDKAPASEYKVGQAFRAKDVRITCNYSDGTSEIISGSNAKITANGTSTPDGYRFKQAGQKNVVVTYGGKTANYKLRVVPNVTKKVDDCELISELKTKNYKVGQGFKASELKVRCFYTDGTYQDFDHNSIEVYVGGTAQIDEGYKFKEKGKKSLTIAFLEYKTTDSITVK